MEELLRSPENLGEGLGENEANPSMAELKMIEMTL